MTPVLIGWILHLASTRIDGHTKYDINGVGVGGVGEATPMTISDAFRQYSLDVIAYRNQSRRTEEHYQMYSRSLLKFWGDVDIGTITFTDVRDWKAYLDQAKTASTVRNYLGGLRNVLKHTQRKGIQVMDPELITLPKRDDKITPFITDEQVAQLINAVSRVRSKAIISLLYASGIRLSEMISLNRSDLQDGTFTIIGKNSKPRLCFYDERTRYYIEQYLATRHDNYPALFISNQHHEQMGRMTPTNVQFILKAARERAGIVKLVTPHVLRHSYATNLLRNNCNIRYVQVLLGHANISTTMRYTHVVDEDLRRVYAEHHTV